MPTHAQNPKTPKPLDEVNKDFIIIKEIQKKMEIPQQLESIKRFGYTFYGN